MSEIDFHGLAQALLHRVRELLPEWLPGGKVVSNEYTCANLQGGAGNSLKVNVVSGKWADFAQDIKGGDLISLYAAIHRISQVEAARALQPRISAAIITKQSKVQPSDDTLMPPPAGASQPNFIHKKFGRSTAHWTYRDHDGAVLFYVSRHEYEDRKEFMPWSWSKSLKRWVNKMWPKPRPLYGLDLLKKNPKAPVLVVEGEKACDAAREITKNSTYVVVTWPSGSSAPMLADWTPLHGRKVLLWPDADDKNYPDNNTVAVHLRGQRKPEHEQPGHSAMLKIANALAPHCEEVKILSVYNLERVDGWDAANALAEGMDWQQFLAFAKPRAQLIAKPAKAEIMPDIPPAPPIEAYQVDVNMTVQDASPLPTDTMWTKWQTLGLALTDTKNPTPLNNSDNVSRIFEGDDQFKGRIWYDEFHQKIFTTWKTGVLRPWSDAEHLALYIVLQREYGLAKITESAIKAAVGAYARQDTRNEPRDWMESLKWDGQPRIENFLATHMGCVKEPEEYVKAISMNFWISMIARIYQPGVKADNAVVLEGSQGVGKSTALNVIAGKWFIETNEDPRNKDFYLILQGALIVEIAELDSFSKADLLTVKKTMSCRVDRYRAPYDAYVADHPRSCIFVGTTNQDDYLKDPTGARRFWPTMTGAIDLEKIKADRDQLFAEAVARYKLGWPHWIVPKELAEQVQEDRYDGDPWESMVLKWVKQWRSVTIMDVAEHVIEMDKERVDRRVQNRIGAILRRAGYKNQSMRFNGEVMKRWANFNNGDTDFGSNDSRNWQQLTNYAPKVRDD